MSYIVNFNCFKNSVVSEVVEGGSAAKVVEDGSVAQVEESGSAA